MLYIADINVHTYIYTACFKHGNTVYMVHLAAVLIWQFSDLASVTKFSMHQLYLQHNHMYYEVSWSNVHSISACLPS